MSSSVRNISISSVLNKKKTKIKKESCIENAHISDIGGCDTNTDRNETNVFAKKEIKMNIENLNDSDYQRNCSNFSSLKNIIEKPKLKNKSRNTTKACLINMGDENNTYSVKKSKKKKKNMIKKMSLPMNSKVASINKNTKKNVEDITLNLVGTNVNGDEKTSDFTAHSVNGKMKLQGYDFLKNKKSVIMKKSQNANIFKKPKNIKLLFKGKNIKEILNKKTNTKIAKHDQQKKNKCCNLNIDKTKSNSNNSENVCNEENNNDCTKNSDNAHDEISDNSCYNKNNLDNKESENMRTEDDRIYSMYRQNDIINNIKYSETYSKGNLLKNGDIQNSDHAAFLKEETNGDKQNIFETHSSSGYIQENDDDYLSTNCKSIDLNENKIDNKCSEYNDIYTNEQSGESRDGYITYKTYVLQNELEDTNNTSCENGEHLSANDYDGDNDEQRGEAEQKEDGEEEDTYVNHDIQDRSYTNEIESETAQHEELDEMKVPKNIDSVVENNKNYESSFSNFNDLTDGSLSSISDSFSLKRLPKIPKNINVIDSNEHIPQLDEEDLSSSSLNINLKESIKNEKRKREVKINGISKVYENDKACYYSTTVSKSLSNNKLSISQELYEDNNIVSVSEEHSSSYLEDGYDMNSNISWESKIKDEYESIGNKNIIRCKQGANNFEAVNEDVNSHSGCGSNFMSKIKKKNKNKYDLSKSDNYFIDNINDEKKNVEKFYFANSEHSYSNNSSLNMNMSIEKSNGENSNICKKVNNIDDTHYSDENNFLTSNSLNMQNSDHSSAINIENISNLKESNENDDKKITYHNDNNGECISQDNNSLDLSLLEMGEYNRRNHEIDPVQCDNASNNESEQDGDNCIITDNYNADKNEYLVTPRFYNSNILSNTDNNFHEDSETVQYRGVDNNPSAELFYSSSSLNSHNSLEQSQTKMYENKILTNNNEEEIEHYPNENEDAINEKSDTNFENENNNNNNNKIEDNIEISESINLINYGEHSQDNDTESEKNEMIDKDENENSFEQVEYKSDSKKDVEPETEYKTNDNDSAMLDSSFLIEDEKDGKLGSSLLSDDTKKKKKNRFKGNILQSIKKFIGKRGAPSPKKIAHREEAEKEEKIEAEKGEEKEGEIDVEAEVEKEEVMNVEVEEKEREEIDAEVASEKEEVMNVEVEPEKEEVMNVEVEPEKEEVMNVEVEPEKEDEISVEVEVEKEEEEHDNNNDKTDTNTYEQTEQEISLDVDKLEHTQFSVSNTNTEMLNINKNVFDKNMIYYKRIKSMEYNPSLYINKECEKKYAYSDDENIKVTNKLRRENTEQHNKNCVKIDEAYDKACGLEYENKETKNENENDHNEELKYNSNDDSSVCGEFNNKKYISELKRVLQEFMEKKAILENKNITVEENDTDAVPSEKVLEPKIVEAGSIEIDIVEAEEDAFTPVPVFANPKIDEENEKIEGSKLLQDDKEEDKKNIPSSIIDEISLIKISNDQLTKENDSLKINCYNLTNLIDDIKKEKSKYESENCSLKEQNEELKSDNETLRSDNDSLRSDNETLRCDNDSLRSDNETLRSDNDSLRSDNETLRCDNDSLRSDNETLRCDNDSLRSDNETLINDNETLTERNEKLRNENGSLKEQNGELTHKCEDLRKQNEEGENKISKLMEENERIKKDMEKIAKEKSMIKKEYEILLEEKNSLKTENISNILKIKLLKDEITKVNNNRTELEIELENSKTNIMQKNDDINNKNILIDELINEKNLLEEQILTYDEKIEEIESKNIENDNLKMEIIEIKNVINSKDIEISDMKTNENALRDEIKKYINMADIDKQRINNLMKEVGIYRTDLESRCLEIKKYQGEAKIHEEESNKIKQELDAYRQEIEKIRTESNKLDEENNKYKNEINLLRKDNDELKNKVAYFDAKEEEIRKKEKADKDYELTKLDNIKKENELTHSKDEKNIFDKDNNSKDINESIINNKESKQNKLFDFLKSITNKSSPEHLVNLLGKKKIEILNDKEVEIQAKLDYTNYGKICEEIDELDLEKLQNAHKQLIKEYIFLEYFFKEYKNDKEKLDIENKSNEHEEITQIYNIINKLDSEKKKKAFQYLEQLCSSLSSSENCENDKVNNFENESEEIEWINMIKKLFVKLDTNENDTILDKIFKKTNEIIKNVEMVKNDLSNINSSNNNKHMNTQIDCFKIIAHLNTIFGDTLFINSNIALIQQTIKEKNKFMDNSKLDTFKNIDTVNDKEKVSAFNMMRDEINKNNTENLKANNENNFEWEQNLITFFELCFCSDLFIILCHLCKGINEINSYVRKNDDDKLERSIFYFMKSLDDIINFYKSDNVNTYFLESYVDLFQMIKQYIVKIEHIIKSEKKDKVFKIVYEIYNIKKVIRFILLSFFKFHNMDTASKIQLPLLHNNITTMKDTKQKVDLAKSSNIDKNEKFYKDEDSAEKTYWRSLMHSQSHGARIEIKKYGSSQNKNEDSYYWNEYGSTFVKEQNYMNKTVKRNAENVLTQLDNITNKIIQYNYNSHIVPALIANHIDESIILERKEYEKEFSYRRENSYEENNTSCHILIKKRILENIRLNTIIINSTDFIEYIKEDIIKEKLNKNIFFKKNFSINIDIIHKHLCIMFRLNIGIDYDYFHDKFISFLNKIISQNVNNTYSDIPQISITNLPKELNYDDSYFSHNNLDSKENNTFSSCTTKNNDLAKKKSNETTEMNYPLLEIDNKFMGILFNMWQKMEINFFEKIYNDNINYSSNKILEPEEISKKNISDTDSIDNNHTNQNKPNYHLDIDTQNDDNKINKENKNCIKSNTFLSKYKISNELREQDYSIEAYIKLMVLDVFKCTDEKKEISIDDFIVLFKNLNINIKIDAIQTTWGIIIGCRNMNIALKEKISVESFIKKAYTTNPSLIFYEYCKTKVKLKEAKKNIKLLQVYNKKMLLLLKK
ncbi:conserved Plasmodium protein, unknown function [Plasmodium vinckei brucechwatti]|uniref:Uncharacterized protein n=1 Tax=Plasmodium vinckei brucechwatti TaxID=119398 RepID=A0A6V7SQ40_PLAVN|nr:conserved Plasmodium protein, unknown function [Plasmodium vinckei brucechwatti]